MPAAIFSENQVKILRQHLNLNDAAYILTGDFDPTTEARNAPKGSIYLRTGTLGGSVYVKQDDGLSTNWLITVGSDWDAISLNFDPILYQIQNSRLDSHLSGIDSALGSALGGHRNIYNNGDFNFWQGGNLITSLTDGHIADCHYLKSGDSSAIFTAAQNNLDVPNPLEFGGHQSVNCLHVLVTTADTSPTSTSHAYVEGRIEGYDYAQLVGRTCILSFKIKGTKTGKQCVSFHNSGSDRSFIAEVEIEQANTWEWKWVKVTFDDLGGTQNYVNGTGLRVRFPLYVGTAYRATAGEWHSDNVFGTSEQIDWIDSDENELKLSQIRLYVGQEPQMVYVPKAPSFQSELALMQRYYQTSYVYGNFPGTVTNQGSESFKVASNYSNTVIGVINYLTKRLSGSDLQITLYSTATGTAHKVRAADNDRNASAENKGNDRAYIRYNDSTLSPGDNIQFHWEADARLG